MARKSSLKHPSLEVIPTRSDVSWQRLDRRLEEGIPFLWHHHPQMELTLTMNCRGQRFVGDNVSSFDDGDLAMIGANLPHTWVSHARMESARPFHAQVIWFDKDWLRGIGQSAAELSPLVSLADRAQRGLSFTPSARIQARRLFDRLFALPPQEGLTTLLELLRMLSLDDDAIPLASQAVISSMGEGYARIDRVLHYLHANYEDAIRLEDLAEIAALSPSGLHRMFRKHLQTTVSGYLINLRIGEACARITASDTPIGIISQDVGYQSQANFNRHFLRLRSMTPREFRKTHRSS